MPSVCLSLETMLAELLNRSRQLRIKRKSPTRVFPKEVLISAWVFFLYALNAVSSAPVSAQADRYAVDTALVVSVDVSSSVDNKRYDLQLEGIAQALEDSNVIKSILNGPRGAILFSLVTWSDEPRVDVSWRRISSVEEAQDVAQTVRRVPRNKGNFTCLGKMLKFLNEKVLTRITVKALRTVVDVSGDGKDNCNPPRPIASYRDEIVSYGATINGLPILEGREADTLEGWYAQNIKGGFGSFILPAAGFADFGRAIRQKFVIEISNYAPVPYEPSRQAAVE